jgi:hypothetical protein
VRVPRPVSRAGKTRIWETMPVNLTKGALCLFLGLRLSAVALATMDLPAASALWTRDHSHGIAQTRNGPAIFVDQHFSNTEAGRAVHPFGFLV